MSDNDEVLVWICYCFYVRATSAFMCALLLDIIMKNTDAFITTIRHFAVVLVVLCYYEACTAFLRAVALRRMLARQRS